MAVFFCVQKPESIYDDNRGQSYEYFQRLPNGWQIEEGDWLIFTLTGSTSKNGQKVTGLGQIETLDYQEQGRHTHYGQLFEVQAIQSSTDLRADWW